MKLEVYKFRLLGKPGGKKWIGKCRKTTLIGNTIINIFCVSALLHSKAWELVHSAIITEFIVSFPAN